MAPSQSQSNPLVWFVTGASTGFGRLVTEYALENGDRVVATLRKPSMMSDLSAQYPDSQLLVLQLDVCDAAAIKGAFKQAITSFNRIDVVLNNAGFYAVAEAEGISDKVSRALFDTMFWGAENVMKEAISCFRDVNRPMGGQLLNLSSRTALLPQAGGVMYASAKAALEALTEGYAAELDPKWNIRFVVLEPGLFRTAAVSNCIMEPPLAIYASNPSLPSMKYRALYPGIDNTHFDGDAKKFSDLVCRLVRMKNLPSFLRLPVHRVSLESASAKGAMFIEAAERLAEWSEDLL